MPLPPNAQRDLIYAILGSKSGGLKDVNRNEMAGINSRLSEMYGQQFRRSLGQQKSNWIQKPVTYFALLAKFNRYDPSFDDSEYTNCGFGHLIPQRVQPPDVDIANAGNDLQNDRPPNTPPRANLKNPPAPMDSITIKDPPNLSRIQSTPAARGDGPMDFTPNVDHRGMQQYNIPPTPARPVDPPIPQPVQTPAGGYPTVLAASENPHGFDPVPYRGQNGGGLPYADFLTFEEKKLLCDKVAEVNSNSINEIRESEERACGRLFRIVATPARGARVQSTTHGGEASAIAPPVFAPVESRRQEVINPTEQPRRLALHGPNHEEWHQATASGTDRSASNPILPRRKKPKNSFTANSLLETDPEVPPDCLAPRPGNRATPGTHLSAGDPPVESGRPKGPTNFFVSFPSLSEPDPKDGSHGKHGMNRVWQDEISALEDNETMFNNDADQESEFFSTPPGEEKTDGGRNSDPLPSAPTNEQLTSETMPSAGDDDEESDFKTGTFGECLIS